MAVVWNPALSLKETECTCAACKTFWRKAFQSGNMQVTSSERASLTAILGNQDGLMKKGDRVLINASAFSKLDPQPLQGVVQYVGLADEHLIAPETKVGVCLYDNVYSVHNGMYKGKRYFFCPRGHGAMVPYSDVTPLNPIPRTRPVVGNSMFPSFNEVKKRRKLREQKIQEEEDKLRKEHELKRRAQMERYSKSAPQPRISPRPTKASRLRIVGPGDKPNQPLKDEYDIAYKDYQYRERQRQLREMDEGMQEEVRLRQMKRVFGGGERAERMAETLRKLKKAYEEGRIVAMAERDY